MTNLDDHMEEHLNLKAQEEARLAAEAETQSEFENMHYRAAQDNDRFNNIRRRLPTLHAIANCIPDTYKPTVDVEDGKLMVCGIDAEVSMEEEFTKVSSWRSKPTGKHKVVVGWHGSARRHYPQTKGGHSYQKIADYVVEYVCSKVAHLTAKQQEEMNRTTVNGLAAELGMERYQSALRPTNSAMFPVQVEFKISGQYTVEQAKALVLKLREAGFKVQW